MNDADNDAEDRIKELADESRSARAGARDDAADAVDRLREALDRAEAAWSAVDEIRQARAEITLLSRLYDLDRPDDVRTVSEAVEDLSDLREALSAGLRRLKQIRRSYPKDARSGSRGVMLQRRLSDLLGTETGSGRVYGRSQAVRRLLSDETAEVASARLQQRLRELYAEIDPAKRDGYRPPVEDGEAA